MKTLFATLITALISTATALAHEGHEHPAGGGLFGLPPEYVHVLLNPLPVYGMAMGILALGAALLLRNKTAQVIGLGLVILAAASAWPVAHYGLNAFKEIRGLTDDAGADALDEHMERAEKLSYFFYATALLGVAALVSQRKFPKAALPLTAVTLIAAVASLGAGGWISKAGGQIRHPEFRGTPAAATNAAPHQQHGAAEPASEKMQPPKTGSEHRHGETKLVRNPQMAEPKPGGEHKHGETAEPTAEKIPLPTTLDGVWKAIHAYHGELESAVNARQFGEAQSGAKTIGALAKKLVAVAPAERKSAVESGVTKINQALDDLKSSAETGSDSVLKTRFKEFEQALQQLEPPMKKP